MSDEIKEKIFYTIQTFLKNPPVIIWGSGATVALGVPSMWALNTAIEKKIKGFNPNGENLEIELGKSEYKSRMPEIKKIIWDAINEADEKVLAKLISDENGARDGIKGMVGKFRDAHPQVVNIITTNYDCVLEHVMAFYGIPFTDGFEGKELSPFDSYLFQDKNMVNLVKVHGSLNWFKIESRVRYLKQKTIDAPPVIICPGKNKYQEAYQTPYRELIQKADDFINGASSFLVVGFGFNDEHLTPKIKEKVGSGTPIVLITKEITGSCKSELSNAQKYVFLQEGNNENTNILFKTGKDDTVHDETIGGDFWKLDRFMEVL